MINFKKKILKYNSHINLEIIELNQIVNDTITRLNQKDTPSAEMTEIGRVMKLLIFIKEYICMAYKRYCQ